MAKVIRNMATYYRVEKEKIWAGDPIQAADHSIYRNSLAKYVTVKNLTTGDVWTVDMQPERAVYIMTERPEREPYCMPGGIGI